MSRAALHGAEGDFAMPTGADGDHGRPAEIEIIAIPQISLHDPPTADELAARGRAHAGVSMSLGSRVRL